MLYCFSKGSLLLKWIRVKFSGGLSESLPPHKKGCKSALCKRLPSPTSSSGSDRYMDHLLKLKVYRLESGILATG